MFSSAKGLCSNTVSEDSEGYHLSPCQKHTQIWSKSEGSSGFDLSQHCDKWTGTREGVDHTMRLLSLLFVLNNGKYKVPKANVHGQTIIDFKVWENKRNELLPQQQQKKLKIPKQNQTKTQLFSSPALRFLNDTQGFPTLTKPAVYSGSKLQI